MHLVIASGSRFELSRALRFMTEALDILDDLGAPGEIGSTLDLAAARVAEFLDHGDGAACGMQTPIIQPEREFQASPTRDERKPSPWNYPLVR